MKAKNTISRLIRQYQTRQQLSDLPSYLIDDIGKTPEEIKQELSKNSVTFVLSKTLALLIMATQTKLKMTILSQPLNTLFNQLLRRA